MHPELRGDLVDRLRSPNRLRGHFRLEVSTEYLVFLFVHYRLRLLRRHPLKWLSGKRGPL
jgi:hypothetical protein